MSARAVRILGIVITVIALGALVAYLVKVGLERADKIASVIGLFVAIIGLAMAALPAAPIHRQDPPSPADGVPDDLAVGRDSAEPRTVVNTAAGDILGPVIQAGTIDGDITFGSGAQPHDSSGRRRAAAGEHPVAGYGFDPPSKLMPEARSQETTGDEKA